MTRSSLESVAGRAGPTKRSPSAVDRAARLRAAVAALDGDLARLFAERIEHQAEPGASGIGLLIVKKDHGARVGARLVQTGDDAWEARVQVTLDAEQIGGGR